jgi:hypothetical protein
MDHKLLEKYWNAETSTHEEEQLMREMSNAQGPEGTYFKMLAEARKLYSSLTVDDIDAYNLKQTLNASRATVRPITMDGKRRCHTAFCKHPDLASGNTVSKPLKPHKWLRPTMILIKHTRKYARPWLSSPPSSINRKMKHWSTFKKQANMPKCSNNQNVSL